jgi:hypothetical protein
MKLKPIKADKVLMEMARTFRVRNKVYGNNYLNYGQIMKELFPRGIRLDDAYSHIVYHWLSMKMVKLTRFLNSGMTHLDSLHDDSVYGAMLEDFIRKHKPRKKQNDNKSKRKH